MSIRASHLSRPVFDFETYNRHRFKHFDTSHARLNVRGGAVSVNPTKQLLNRPRQQHTAAVTNDSSVRVKTGAHNFTLTSFTSFQITSHNFGDCIVFCVVISHSFSPMDCYCCD